MDTPLSQTILERAVYEIEQNTPRQTHSDWDRGYQSGFADAAAAVRRLAVEAGKPPALTIHVDPVEFERVMTNLKQTRNEAIWNAQAHAQIQAVSLDWQAQYEQAHAERLALRSQVARDRALRAEMQQTAEMLLSPEHIKERVCNPAIAAALLELLRHYEVMEKQNDVA